MSIFDSLPRSKCTVRVRYSNGPNMAWYEADRYVSTSFGRIARLLLVTWHRRFWRLGGTVQGRA